MTTPERNEWRLIRLLNDQGLIEYAPDDGGEGISVNLYMDPLVFFLLEKKREEIVKLADKGRPEDLEAYCSGINETFQESVSATEFIGHVIEHRVISLAVKKAVEQGHEGILARGYTTSFPRGAEIQIQITSEIGKGFGLKDHLLQAIDEMESLLTNN